MNVCINLDKLCFTNFSDFLDLSGIYHSVTGITKMKYYGEKLYQLKPRSGEKGNASIGNAETSTVTLNLS